MQTISDILDAYGYITSAAVLVGVIYIAYLIIKALAPILYRLGLGISKRKLAIFASGEFGSLKDMLKDSGIFKEKNLIQINKNDLDKAKEYTVFLVHWNEYKDKLDDILLLKSDNTALIIYAPQNEGIIDQQSLEKINSKRNSIIVNMRGRLLNDIFISMMTTGYVK